MSSQSTPCFVTCLSPSTIDGPAFWGSQLGVAPPPLYWLKNPVHADLFLKAQVALSTAVCIRKRRPRRHQYNLQADPWKKGNFCLL